jgi:hypothetical protein
MKKALLIGIALLLLLAWRDWSRRELVHAPGILVKESPKQGAAEGAAPVQIGGYRLTPRASFDLRARVLSVEKYRWGDEADLSPVDLAMGWGPMSDQSVLDRITITQGGRWYFTRYEYPAPLSDRQIINHSSNMHMIPANAWVEKKLSEIRKGHVVQATGFLVDVASDSGFRWFTSLKRDDTGNGSCEIFYVESLYIEGS